MRKILKGTLLIGSAGLIYDFNSKEKNVLRALRTVRCGLNILYQYKIRFSEENANEIHEKIAKDIYETCKENDGLYVKFGQGMSAMEHLLPPPYMKYLILLQDKAKSSPIDQVKQIFVEELGKVPEELFEYFEENPIASASIAQVHRARLKGSGREVAVKVQKPNIKRQFAFDMIMHKLICAVIQYSFDLPLLFFADFIEENLAKEIDFSNEAKNIRITKENIKKYGTKGKIYIPEVFEEFTSKRILVLEWINGEKVTNFENFVKLGIPKKAVVEEITEFFAKQIFEQGFVHCDPHPGNILIEDLNYKGIKDYRIVILDFGLCIDIQEELKAKYCKFWKSIVDGDMKELEKVAKEWGFGDPTAMVSSALMKPYSADKGIDYKYSSREIYETQMRFKNELSSKMKDLKKMPKEFIFIGRNMNLVRSLNKKSGSIVDRVGILAREANKSYEKYYSHNSKSFFIKLYLSLKFMLYRQIFYYYAILVWIFKRKGIEDLIEEGMVKDSQAIYKSYGFKIDTNTFDA